MVATIALAVGVLVLTGCSGDKPDSAPPPSPTSVPTAAPPPKADICHQLGYAAAARATGGGKKVPCGQGHTAITYYVGSYQPIQDGHLLAVDSTHVQAQLAEHCPAELATYLGTDQENLRLSRLEAVWFGPSLKQTARGAHWFRCDVVAPMSEDQLETLPGNLKGALADGDARDKWGICGSASPSKAGFTRVACDQKHAWRAIRTVDITATRYLAKAATAAGNSTCKDAASMKADGALKYTWSFQWPSKVEWNSGRRYGYCWIPDAN
jgi:hypothetical protein